MIRVLYRLVYFYFLLRKQTQISACILILYNHEKTKFPPLGQVLYLGGNSIQRGHHVTYIPDTDDSGIDICRDHADLVF